MSKHGAVQGRLAGLEAGRGIAALLVVTLHTWDHVVQAYPWFPLGALFAFGHAGVDFFFVLSGFIIMHVHAHDVGRPGRLARYAERRFTRVYPFYWAVLAVTLGAAALSPTHPFPSPGLVAASLLLLPVPAPPIISVAWTLQNEILFYATFAVLIVNRRVGVSVLAAWFAALLAATLTGSAPPGPLQFSLAATLTSYFNFHFFFGLGAAALLRRHAVPRPLTVLLASSAAFLAIGMAEDARLFYATGILPHLGYGLAATGIVLGLVEAERQGGLAIPPLLRLLGSASYAIYLTHLLGIGATWQVLLASGLAARLSGWAAFLILVGGGIASGTLISVAIEKPIIGLTRRLIVGRNPTSAAAQRLDCPAQERLAASLAKTASKAVHRRRNLASGDG